jgi:hypothetical protein
MLARRLEFLLLYVWGSRGIVERPNPYSTESSPPRLTFSFPQTPWLRSTSSFSNSTEHREYVDKVLKEELDTCTYGYLVSSI